MIWSIFTCIFSNILFSFYFTRRYSKLMYKSMPSKNAVCVCDVVKITCKCHFCLGRTLSPNAYNTTFAFHNLSTSSHHRTTFIIPQFLVLLLCAFPLHTQPTNQPFKCLIWFSAIIINKKSAAYFVPCHNHLHYTTQKKTRSIHNALHFTSILLSYQLNITICVSFIIFLHIYHTRTRTAQLFITPHHLFHSLS